MIRELRTAAAKTAVVKTPRADDVQTLRRATAPTKPAAAPPPGRPRVTPRRGNVLCKEPSYEKPPCVIPADCKTPDAKVDPSATVLDSGFPYVDIIQRQDLQKSKKRGMRGTPDKEQQIWWRKPTTPRADPRKTKKHSRGNASMTAAGFSTLSLNVAVTKAEAYYQHKLKDNPANTAILKDYGCWLHSQGRLIEAERLFKKALLLERRDVSVICAYAALLWESGKYGRAEDMYRMALTFEPHHIPSLLDYGLVLFSKGDFVASLQRFRKAAEVEPSNEQALLGVAVALEKVGRTGNEEIDAVYQQILEDNPTSFDALHSYAQFLKNKEGRLFEAQDCYQRALAIRPDDVEALCSFGVLLTEAASQDPSAFARAQTCFQHALTIQPRNPDTLYSYAVLLCAWHRSEAETSSSKPGLQIDRSQSSPPQSPAFPHRPISQAPVQTHRPALSAIELEPPQSPSEAQAPPLDSDSDTSPWTKAVGGHLSEDNDLETARSGPLSPYRPSTMHETATQLEPQIETMPDGRDSDDDEHDNDDKAETALEPPQRRDESTPQPRSPPTQAPARVPPSSLPMSVRHDSGVNTQASTPLAAWRDSSADGPPLPSDRPRPSSGAHAAFLPTLTPRRPTTPRQPTKLETARRAGRPSTLRRTVSAYESEHPQGSSGRRMPAGVAECEGLFKKVLEHRPEDADALCSYAIFVHKVRAVKALAGVGSVAHLSALQEAEKLYRRVLKVDPKHALALQGRQELREALELK